MNASQENFVPIGIPVSSSKNLELNFIDQQFLTYEIKRTSTELESVPSIVPDKIDAVFDHIPLNKLPSLRSKSTSKAEMGFKYSETKDGRLAAMIGVSESDGRPTRFTLSPAANLWEEWHPSSKEAVRFLEHSDLVGLMASRLEDEKLFNPLLDITEIQAVEITHLLAEHLKGSARSRNILTRYSSVDSTTADNYESDVETSLAVKEINNRRAHRLAITALYPIGNSLIQKQYSYKFGPYARSRSGGAVTIGSSDGIAKNRLTSYATIDQETNFPIDSLHLGLNNLRDRYDLHTQRRAA